MTRFNDQDRPGVQARVPPCAPDRLLSGSSSAAEQRYQIELYKGIRFQQSRWRPDTNMIGHHIRVGPTAPTHGSRLPEQPVSQALLQMVRTRQAQAYDELQQVVLGSKVGPGQASSILTGFSGCGETDALSSSELAIIDLTDRLFDYLRADDPMPSPSKTLLSYLYAPVLKVALIDPQFFERSEHPARMLLNSLAEAGARWVSPGGCSHYDIYGKIRAVVLRLLAEFTFDARLFSDVLVDFSSDVQSLAGRQALIERRAVDKERDEETLRVAKKRVYAEVRQRTLGRALPSTALLLLMQPWADYLAFVLLRTGDASRPWQEALQGIDDLLHSLEPKPVDEAGLGHPSADTKILSILGRGLTSIDYDQAKGHALLEGIQSLQALARQGAEIVPAPAPMRHKLETMIAVWAGVDTCDDRLVTASLQMLDAMQWVEGGGLA